MSTDLERAFVAAEGAVLSACERVLGDKCPGHGREDGACPFVRAVRGVLLDWPDTPTVITPDRDAPTPEEVERRERTVVLSRAEDWDPFQEETRATIKADGGVQIGYWYCKAPGEDWRPWHDSGASLTAAEVAVLLQALRGGSR